MTDDEKLSRLCWIAGVPAAGLVTLLVLLAESARSAGHHGTGNLLSVVQFLICFSWFRFAWHASGNIRDSAWKPLARGALAAGLVLSAML